MAAITLLEAGRSVTLLEAGTELPSGAVVRAGGHTVFRRYGGSLGDHASGFSASGDPGTVWYRALRPGGLSNWWTGAVPRFSRVDFGSESNDEAHRWPISYDDLEPHYDAAESLIGVSGTSKPLRNLANGTTRHLVELPDDWEALSSSAEAFGHDLLPIPLAKGTPWMAVRRGTEFNSWSSLTQRANDNPLLTVQHGARVVRLNWDSRVGRVTGVDYLDTADGEVRTIAADTVVVAAGAINSTRLLLNSRSDDFPNGLGNAHDVLGRYLHDHPKDWWLLETDVGLTLPAHPVYLSRAADVGVDGLPCSWTIGLASVKDRPLAMMGRNGTRFGVQVFGTIDPNPEHRVVLRSASTDPIDVPEVDISLRYDEKSRAALSDARQRLLDVLERGGISGRVSGSSAVNLQPGESVHYGGTCRMHADPRHGMVDGFGRLHLVPNVHVVDNSVFTTAPEKNPTLTAMAIASRSMQPLCA